MHDLRRIPSILTIHVAGLFAYGATALAGDPRSGPELELGALRDGDRCEFRVSGLEPFARGFLVLGTQPRCGEPARLAVEPLRTRAFRANAVGTASVLATLPPVSSTVFAQAVSSGGTSQRVSGVSAFAGPAFVVQSGDVIVTEVQRAPGLVADVLGEWFEVRNTTTSAIDLEGWTIADEGGEFHVIQNGGAGLVILPGELRVLGRNADAQVNGGVPVQYAYSGLMLDDLADEIVLVAPTGTIVDRVAWTSGGGWPASVTGRALALDAGSHGVLANDLAANWCLASAPIDILVAGSDRGTPGMPNPSCACAGASDLPDGLFQDSNCDGIDGTVARAVFVAVGGAANAPGTPQAPLGSVQAAIDLAAADPSRDHVYVSEGTYTGTVTLRQGVSVWGGYSAASGWTRSAAHVTTLTNALVQSDGVVGVRALNLSAPLVLGDVRVVTGTATGNGTHNIGIRAHQASSLRLERVLVLAGQGSHGAAGAAGTQLDWWINSGGSGGNGGNALGGGWDGQNGNGPGGSGGAGGGVNSNGSSGGPGWTGLTGAAGIRGSNVASVLPTGLLAVARDGGAGDYGQPGRAGGGGGGGGGGLFPGFPGGRGGNGGSGGRGGQGGLGGTGGGSSLALLVSQSTVVAEGCTLTAGNGAAGGAGGAPLAGTAGANGVNGVTASGAGDGGRGGNGGAGASGGRGAGGGGGHSYCIVIGPGATATLQSATLGVGTPGAGGAAPNGQPGLAGEALLVKQL
ncbi:MAG: lamin tail domain-containing protein [Planctomycetes bacterium]|nr:lamin tail domain-containing protein [Planctomycetota bacterium]